MTTSSRLSTPPFRISPELACFFKGSEDAVDFFTGDTGLLGTMKGFDASARLFDWKKEADRGVFVSDRERWRVGVFGGYAIYESSLEGGGKRLWFMARG